MRPKPKNPTWKDASAELRARQYAQYQALAAIVEELGPFDQSSGADGAHYLIAADNPFAAQGMQCANCAFFQGGGRCEAVEGAIDPDGLCKLWIIPESLLVQPLVYEVREPDELVVKVDISKAVHKTFEIKLLEQRKDGGRILISTPSYDRDKDRVMPMGGQLDDYLRNPVVQWGHNYWEPWATVGRTTQLDVTDQGIVADFELRPAANDQDPQNIVLLLWGGGWVNTASIGFIPLEVKPNTNGGLDFLTWGLLEWSIVPIPANQDALRLAATTYPKALQSYIDKAGARHSAEDMSTIQRMHDDALTLGAACTPASEQPKGIRPKLHMLPAPAFDENTARAWVRRLEVESEAGPQTLFAAYSAYEVRIPENAVILDCDPDTGEIITVPHPDAGQTVKRKQVAFIPPIDTGWDEYSYLYCCQGDDRQAVEGYDDWDVMALSEVLTWLPVAEGKAAAPSLAYVPLRHITRRGMRLATTTLRKQVRAQQRAAVPNDTDEDAAQLLARLNALPIGKTRR